jgi:rubrerythrin
MPVLERDAEVNWVGTRMRKLLADAPTPKWRKAFCPVCGKHCTRHNDRKCPMHFTEEA